MPPPRDHLRCDDCRKRLGILTPKVQYGERWRCPDCAYRFERERDRVQAHAQANVSP